MPEMYFRVRWPDATVDHCYSPSLIVRDYLRAGTHYPVSDFVLRSRTALAIGSERVRAKFGFACSSAADQIIRIETRAAPFLAKPAAHVYVEALLDAQRQPLLPEEGTDTTPAKEKANQSTPSTHSLQSDSSASVHSSGAPASFPVVVIGGGQAGLSISYLLKKRGIDHVVLERGRVGFAWRDQRWDSFCLVTPNWQCALPGFPYDGPDPDGFMVKDEIVQYLERYRAHFSPPVREGVAVEGVDRLPDGRFVIETSDGLLHADQVVVATGGYHSAVIPAMAAGIPDSIAQLHSVTYRNPESLPDGDVLVVGTGQSGCQLAEDLHLAGRRVHLCVGDAPRVARRYRGKDVVAWLDDMGYYALPVDKHPLGTGVRDKTNHYVTGRDGGRDIDLRAFARDGMQLYGRLSGIENGIAKFDDRLAEYLDNADAVSESIKTSIDNYIAQHGIDAPQEARYQPVWQPGAPVRECDLAKSGITTVLWSIGFHSDFRWIDLPVFDERGYPRHDRGITDVPGLYFLGLPWQHTWGSGRFSGIGNDALHLLDAIDALRTESTTRQGASFASSL